jgi:hypothetical protein
MFPRTSCCVFYTLWVTQLKSLSRKRLGTALTHKSHPGTFAAFALDIGAYAKFRKLEGRFREIDITAADSRERCRNSPILEGENLLQLLKNAPADPQEGLDDAVA